jgi:hypothetical protein
MPLWIRKLMGRTDNALAAVQSDYDPEWAEFNLPAGDDLRSLLGRHAARDGQPPIHEYA